MLKGMAILAGFFALSWSAAGGENGAAAPTPGPLPAITDQKPGTWLKRSPLPGGPTSPRKGYESSWDWDPYTKRIIRHGGHNQGGGGPQYFEVWTLDPLTMKWQLRLPNTSPPGICCSKDNLFDPHARKFVRFKSSSLSHGWQWTRMVYLRNSSVWTYDNAKNTWRSMRPSSNAPRGSSNGRCVAYDPHNDVVLFFSKRGITRIYDHYTNTWTQPRPPNEPKAPRGRAYGSMVYDAPRRRFVMFGKQWSDDPVTWAYDIRLNQWTDLKTKEHPPSNRTSPVMSYDSKNQVILCVLKSGPADAKLQTWLFDCRQNTWKRLKPGGGDLGSSGNRNRLMTYIPEYDIFVLENRTKEQQIWTFRWSKEKKALTAPGAPVELAVEVNDKGEATLAWKPGPGPAPAGYRLFRGVGPTPWKAKYAQVGPQLIAKAAFSDTGLARGEVHYYRVAAVGKDGRLSDESIPARTQPRVPDHLTVSVLGDKQVEVSWKKGPAKDVAGYNLYRADVGVYTADQFQRMAGMEDKPSRTGPAPVGAIRIIGKFNKLTPKPIGALTFLDKSVDLTLKDRKVAGTPFRDPQIASKFIKGAPSYRFALYAYRVHAVNALGAESGPSPWSLTIPSPPEGLFSKEDGGTVHLKWQASPEKKLKGYHLYRLNGGSNRSKVVRLTAKPIAATEYSYTANGKGKIGRFFVVAVDALGQDGVPSSPVWAYRMYDKFYKPFGAGWGTWHQ